MKQNKNLIYIVRLLMNTAGVAIALFIAIWCLTLWANRKSEQIPPEVAGGIILRAEDAQVHGPSQIKLETLDGVKDIGYWDYESQWIDWKPQHLSPGKYSVTLRYSRPGKSKVSLILSVGNQKLRKQVPGTGGWDIWRTIPLGTITIPSEKDRQITLRTSDPPSDGIINFVFLKLIPAK